MLNFLKAPEIVRDSLAAAGGCPTKQIDPLSPTLFHWRSPDKTIYSPEVRIIAKSLGKNLAGSTLHLMRSA
jgi:hypothetical protein